MVSTKDILNSSIEIFIKSTSIFLQEDWTIGKALEFLRGQNVPDKILYFYIVNSSNKLVGILATRSFLLSDPKTEIKDAMDTNLVKVGSKATVEQTMELFMHNQLLALPVVDVKGRFLGVIDLYFCLKEVFDIAGSKEEQDVFQLIGLSLETSKKRSMFQGFRDRMPWLLFNIVGGLTCAMISDYYELTLASFLILAMFIPLVLTLSESISMQAMTVSLYSLQSGSRFSLRLLLSRCWFELRVALTLGLTCGLVVGLASTFWQDGFMPSIVIAFSILISACMSAFFGGILPLILHGLRLDPKLAAGPIGLMLADVLTTFIYLGLATFWLL